MATRLNVILLIPVLVALAFGGFRVKGSVDTWRAADDAVRTARLVRAAAAYSDALMNERDVTAVPLLAGRTNDPVVSAARAATDDAARAFDRAAAHPPGQAGLRRRIATFRSVEPQLASLRRSAYTGQLSGVQTEEWYVTIHHPLTELANELGYGTTTITAYGRTLYAVSLAKAAESLTRSIGTHILAEPAVPAKDLTLQRTALSSYRYLEGIAHEEYDSGATAADQQRLKDALAGARTKAEQRVTAAQHAAEAAHTAYAAPPDLAGMVAEIAAPGRTTAQLRAEGITPEAFASAATFTFDAYRSVEAALADQAAADAARVAAHARRDAVVNSAIVLVALVLAFIVATVMARSMSRSMRRLRSAAFEIAETRLPAMVDQLSRADPGRVDTQVAPIPITSQDEIGEVARAFDQVHREAVRLAAEQALLRGNVNAIFTNLSRRNQGLVERQLTLITELENNEADPDQLQHLFHLDHLATRMRRNGENLLVLAGEETARPWNQPVPLVDVLRAAASEVEAYDRVELIGVPETDIHGDAVTDLVHLLAELLENATTFSSPQTRVQVTATRLPDRRVMIEIHDKGIGLTPEDFTDLNRKLADPPTVDVEIAQRMGLFVVGRLAARHGIRVQLRPSGEQAGTTSLVMLPEPITRGGGGEEAIDGQGAFTVSRIMPEHPAPTPLPGYEQRPAVGPNGSAAQTYEPPAEPYGQPGPLYGESGEPNGQPGPPHGQPDPSYRQPDPSYGQPVDPYGQAGPPYGEPGPPYGPDHEQPYDRDPAPADWTGFPPSYQPPTSQAEFTGPPAARQEWPVPDPQVTEWTPPLPAPAPESVVSPSLTDAGLPRRERPQRTSPDQPDRPEPPAEHGEQDQPGRPGRRDPEAPAQEYPEQQPQIPHSPQQDGHQPDDDDSWQSTNDHHWQRAGQVREPKAGGVTPSGLPRRIPKANLVPGTAMQTPQGGPQVSRAPEDVRGRLSNLRRGVQQGRTAGTDTNGQASDRRFGGPQNQER